MKLRNHRRAADAHRRAAEALIEDAGRAVVSSRESINKAVELHTALITHHEAELGDSLKFRAELVALAKQTHV